MSRRKPPLAQVKVDEAYAAVLRLIGPQLAGGEDRSPERFVGTVKALLYLASVFHVLRLQMPGRQAAVDLLAAELERALEDLTPFVHDSTQGEAAAEFRRLAGLLIHFRDEDPDGP
jgi:hypothetical protein